ncbi:MAG: prepilin-type N-terminal cleavage/methylation domain-containing protein [Campylobacterales bacterium]|nr:prepilin-type N-terminal cleavage/methylation domain-containing protein [Campylobacterales bacterium]
MRHSGFTMIEMIFVIVILGILAAVAIPKFSATRTDAQISSARATISAVRSGIETERQRRLLRGESNYVASLGEHFENVLTYPDKRWSKSGERYSITIEGTTCSFDYNATSGRFLLVSTSGLCASLDI